MNDSVKEWRLKALTDLWTGSVVMEQRNNQARESQQLTASPRLRRH